MHRRIAIVACLLTIVGGASAAWAAEGAAAGLSRPHRAAIAEAQNLLAGVPLPAGSTPSAPQQTGTGQALERPIGVLFFAAEAVRHRFWSVPESPTDAVAWIRDHRPAATRWQGAGSSGSLGSPPSEVFGGYTIPADPGRGLLGGLVSVTAVTADGGATIVRADAFVRYVAPRPAAERVAGRARVLRIDVVNGFGRRLGTVLVSRRAVVRQLAAAVDALPVADFRGVAFSCPAMLSATPIDRLTFRRAAAAPPLATITMPADAPSVPYPCYDTPLRVAGRSVGDMFDGGTVLRLADRLLGLRLARR